MKKIPGVCAVLMILAMAQPAAIEILDFNNVQFLLYFDYTQTLLYTIMKGTAEWQAPDLEIDIEANNEALGLALSLDLARLYRNDYQEILKDCYVACTLADNLVLKAGQFKNPFGRENNKGKKSRAYPDHSVSSGEIAPGQGRGVSLAGKNFLEYMDFEAGLFVSGKTDKQDNNLFKLLPAGNLTAKFKLGDMIKIECGYSGLADLDLSSLLRYQLAQGFALQFDFNFGTRNDLSLFAEFLERYGNSLFLNGDPHWTHGFFGSAAWRLAEFEPFVTYEHFLANTSTPTTGDTMVVTGGANYYPPGELALRVYYRWDYTYLTLAGTHLVGAMLNYRL